MKSILLAARPPRRLLAKGLGAPVLMGAMPVALSNFAAGCKRGKIDVFGGLVGRGFSRQRRQYDIATKKWTASADLFAFTWGAGLTTDDGFWVTTGLRDGTTYSNQFLRFDPNVLGNYVAKADVIGGLRIESRMVEREGVIHLLAGYTQGGPKTSNLHSTYDAATNGWIPRTTTPSSANGHVVGEYKGKVYMAGGYSDDSASNLARFSQYNPADNTWKAMPAMPGATSWVNGCSIGNLLLVGAVIGGMIAVYVFNFETNQWSTLTTNIPQRWGGEWVADENGVWFLGGCAGAPGAANYDNLARYSDMYYFPLLY